MRAQPENVANIFKVYLTQVGGSNGTKTTMASYTYDVFSDAGKTVKIGTALAPEWRVANGPVSAATKGQASIDSAGNAVLEIAYEVWGSKACT